MPLVEAKKKPAGAGFLSARLLLSPAVYLRLPKPIPNSTP